MLPDIKDANKWTVLIVDDEPDNLGVPQQVLQYYGATVHTAEDGAAGLKVLEDINAPTFMLLDLSMPGMDGWQMLKQLRADQRYNQTVVIAVTAHAMKGDRERTLEAGFDGYIAKPFMIDTFVNEIKRCLEAANGATANSGELSA